MAAASNEKRVDFLSDEFDPLTALYSENVPLPCPEVRPFNNLAEYENVMQRRNAAVRRETNKCQKLNQTGSDSTGIRSKESVTADPLMRTNAEREMLFRQMMQRAAKIKQDRMEFDPLIPGISEYRNGSKKDSEQLPDMMLKGKQKSQSQRNVFSRMKEYGSQRKKGPFGLLYRAVEERIRVKVWTRSAKQLRGYCKGYIVAFDRHWNLAMVDVDEVFCKPCLPRTPYPSCKALEVETGEVVMMLNEDEPEEGTSENSMDASHSNSPDEDIDALALRLQMLKQELSEIPSGEESAGSGPGLSEGGPENDETDACGGEDAPCRFDEKELLTQSDVSKMSVSQDEKYPVSTHTKTNKDKNIETRIGVSESVTCQEGKDISHVTRSIDFGGGGDAQMKMSSVPVGTVGGAGDVGRLGEVMDKLQVDESSSSSKGEVIYDEGDMEVGGYEEIGVETVETVRIADCGVDEDVVESDIGKKTESSSESKKLQKKSKSSKKHAKSGLEKEQFISVKVKDTEKGPGPTGSQVKKTNKAEKKDSKKKLSKDVSVDKSESVDVDGRGSVVGSQKKSKKSKKSRTDTVTELGVKDKKETKTVLPMGPGEGDTKEHSADAESCDSLAKIAGLVKIPTKSVSAWKIPKKSSKKLNQDSKAVDPIRKSHGDNTGTKSEISDEKSDGRTSTGTKPTWKIPKLSKKSDCVPLSGEKSEGLSVTEVSSRQGTVQKDIGDSVKISDSEEQGSGEKKVIKALKKHVEVVETGGKSQIGELASIVSERLREVKETSVRVARSPKVHPNADVVGSRGGPDPVKKAPVSKPRKPSKAKAVTDKQPDPVRERLKQAGEFSAAHYLKGRLHERHVNKLFLRGDNIAMINLL